ncbi:MAG TPA: hypothetical protein DDZ51_31130 [Planctomycetaceae bacterium]|nr:hypothetical protein [Planctomycetaceae bacterium]
MTRSSLKSESIKQRYRSLARQAVSDKDFDRARFFLSRLVCSDSAADPKDEFQWALIAARSGDFVAAQELINQLAPESGGGYFEAHRWKAIQCSRLVATLDQSSGGSKALEETLLRYRHHLSRSGTDDPLQLLDLWTDFYIASGQIEKGVKKIIESASFDPTRWLVAAIASGEIGDTKQRDKCYCEAELYFAKRLAGDPLDYQSRMGMCRVLVDTGRVNQASDVLDDGLALTDRIELRRMAADLRVHQMIDLKDKLSEDFSQFTSLLAKAFEFDPQNEAAYAMLALVYEAAQSLEQRLELRGKLERLVGRGETVAMAHFTLGAIRWLDGDLDDSLWHTEKAWEINPTLIDVANNLAWLESNRENPDLNRAKDLIDLAISKRPENIEYYATRGFVLMKMERWDEALVDLVRVLPHRTGQARKVAHERLAAVYKSLGQDRLAAVHEEEASNQ